MNKLNACPSNSEAIAMDKNKDWQLELLMEKLRSKASQFKSLVETSKAVRMTLIEKHYSLDSVEKLQHQKCLDTLQHSIKVTSLRSMVERLESLTRQLGLKFVQGTNGMELFISSDMFYLEILLDQNGTVCDVKVHHEGKVEQQSCEELVNCLSKGDFNDFTLQLEGFASIYQLNAEKKVKAKAFTALQSLEADLSTLAQLQTFIKEPFNILYKSPVGILEKRKGGHAMKLTYFVSPYDLINVEKGDLNPITIEGIVSKSLGYSATVHMEGSTGHKLQTCPLISVNRNHTGKGTPSYAPLTNQNSAIIPACFVLKLNKAMPMCVELLKQIQNITELEAMDTSSAQPILALIASHSSDGKLLTGSNRGLFVTLPDQSHCYFMTENRNLKGVIVNSIPFSHPAHVAPILNILRQQALFNTLISSCIRPNSKQDLESMIMLEISALSWTHISISLEHPIEECMATAEIDLSDIANLSCSILSPTSSVPATMADVASEVTTKVLNRSLSIPVTMRSILLHWEKQMMRTKNHFGGIENFNLPLGSGDPGGRNGSSGNNSASGEREIKQEPSSHAIVPSLMSHPHQGMFLNETLMSSANFVNFPNATDSAPILSNVELTNILSGNNGGDGGGKSKRQKRKGSASDDAWKLQRRKDDADLLQDASSCDSTSRSTPLSQETVSEIQTPNSVLGFHSDLELSALDSSELMMNDKDGDFDAGDLQDVDDILICEKKKSPLLGDYDANKLVSPSVSITPITQNQMFGTPAGMDRRPGIEIIPISTTTTTTLPSSITITPISQKSDKDKERKNSKRSSDDKSRLDKKKKRKRDGSPMGPPDKIPNKTDPLAKPVTVSIKPAESPPTSPSSRKFSPSPTQTGRSLSSGKLSPSLLKPSMKTHSPKHSPAHVSSSPKHVIPGLSSPKSSPKHPSTSGSGKPSMSTLKNAANSPSGKGESKKKEGSSSSTSLSSASSSSSSASLSSSTAASSSAGSSAVTSSRSIGAGEKSEKKAGGGYVSSGGSGSSGNSSSNSGSIKSGSGGKSSSSSSSSGQSSVKVKPLDLNSIVEVSNCVAESGGVCSPGLGIDLLKSSNANNQMRNRKTGCLSAIVDKLNSKAQNCDLPTDLTSKPKERSLALPKSDLLGKKLGDGKNSEYVLKHSSDCMKLTINKTRTREPGSKKSSSGTGSPKNHTGLKPGVNSGPASKKPQPLSKVAQVNPLNSAYSSSSASNLKTSKSPNLKSPVSSSGSSTLPKKLCSSPKSSSELSRLKDRPKINKSSSEKSIFGNRDKNKGAGTPEATDGFGVLQGALMMDSLIKKQFDKSFQIPKLSARALEDKKPKAEVTNSAPNNLSRESKVFDAIANSTVKEILPKFPLPMPSGKIFDGNIGNVVDVAKIRSTINNAIAIPTSLTITSTSTTCKLQEAGDDLRKEATCAPSAATKSFSEALGLASRSVDLTSKFVAPQTLSKDEAKDKAEEVLNFSSSSSGCSGGVKDPSPSVSVHIVKSPSNAIVNQSPHASSPGIADDDLMDEALVGIGK